jgi:hypothetical protein
MNYQDHHYGLDNMSDPSYAEMQRLAASSGDQPILDTDPFGLGSDRTYGSYLLDDDTDLYGTPFGQPSHFQSLQHSNDHDHSNDPSDPRAEEEEKQVPNDSVTGREEEEEQEKDDEIQEEGHGWSWLTRDDANAKQQRVWCSVKAPNRQKLSEIVVLLRLNRKNGEISDITAVPSFPGFSPAQKDYWDIVSNRTSAFQSLSTAISLLRPDDCMEIRKKAPGRGNEEDDDRWMIKMANARLGNTKLWFGGQEHKVIFRQCIDDRHRDWPTLYGRH